MIRNIVFDMGKVLLEYEPYQPCRRHAGDDQTAQVLKAAIFDHPDWPAKIDGGLLYEDEYLLDVQDRLETQELKLGEFSLLGMKKSRLADQLQ